MRITGVLLSNCRKSLWRIDSDLTMNRFSSGAEFPSMNLLTKLWVKRGFSAISDVTSRRQW
jgi:hypothetical protein